ncbi:MAG: site-2 protease family protein [Thermoleophilia bacterium]
MQWSYRIFSVFGIQVRMHLTFLLIIAYFAFIWGVVQEPGGLTGALYGSLLVLLLFGLVVIHELTHSRVAQAYGIEVKSITLLPIGGMASMEEFPSDPKKELVISIAGPLSNVVVGALMFLGALFFFDLGDIFSSVDRFYEVLLQPNFRGAYIYLMLINIVLAVFNLLPAFPMDGGRVFRSLLALTMPRPKANRIAIAVGQMFALGLGFLGILTGNILMVLIAVFIYFGAQAEGQGDGVRRVLGELKVSQAVNTEVELARPDQVIGQLAARLFHSYQEDFPVVDERGKVIGIVTRDRLISALGASGPELPVSEAMRTEFPVASPSDSVYDAFVRMRQENVKAMPVLDGSELVGMVSVEDISEVYTLLQAAGPEFAEEIPPETGSRRGSGSGGSGTERNPDERNPDERNPDERNPDVYAAERRER